MKLDGEGFLLRIYLGEQDKWHHMPRHEAIVLKAREMGWQARPFCADPAHSRDVSTETPILTNCHSASILCRQGQWGLPKNCLSKFGADDSY